MATKFEKETFKILRKYFQLNSVLNTNIENMIKIIADTLKNRKKLGSTPDYKPLYVDGPNTNKYK